jgi:hypothetical protein
MIAGQSFQTTPHPAAPATPAFYETAEPMLVSPHPIAPRYAAFLDCGPLAQRTERRLGERFSLLYMQAGAIVPDSTRARHRIGALLSLVALDSHGTGLAATLAQRLGLSVPGDGRHPSHWHQFFHDCRTSDALDAITVIYRYLFWHLSDGAANGWRDAIRQIFDEEGLGYEVDDAGGVHPRIDRAFQRNTASVITGLESERYKTVRELVELSSGHLCSTAPNYKQAWRATLSAVEVLFGLMFPYGRLTTDEIERRLQPVVERAYEGDPTAQRAAQRLLAGFKEWVEASQRYRHHPGAAATPNPPADIAVLSISQGLSLLRWLAGFDVERAA